MTDVKQKARDVVGRVPLPQIAYYGVYDNSARYGGDYYASLADALSAANLLHDPEEVARGKEALEACVAYARATENVRLIAHGITVRNIGRAELERRKPRPRWTVDVSGSKHDGRWFVMLDGFVSSAFPPDAEPEARAYVARKNAEAK